jgi:hypothetical protein
MLIVLFTGFANTGTAKAVTARSVRVRSNELDVIEVNLSIWIESADDRFWEIERS